MQGKQKKRERGFIVTYVLVFAAIFLMILSGILGYILLQLRQSEQKLAWNLALDIAEAGIDRYQWCLNNSIEDDCLGEKDYYDIEGRLVGAYSIEMDSTMVCGQTTQHQIISTGWTSDYPSMQRKIEVYYGRKSIAEFAYILNSSVWIGSDHEINGPYHSNGGIRMDGINQSLLTSAAMLDDKGEWVCTDSFGCDPCPTSRGCRVSGGDCICPGVFTTTSNPTISLFKYPVPPFDFNAITMDLVEIKDKAQNGGGLYFPVSTNIIPGSKGYHLKFLNTGRVQVYAVMALQQTSAYSDEEDWHFDRFTINNESLYGTYTIPEDCSVIYLEDNAWVEGTVKGKVIVVSANLVDNNVDTSIVLPANITYASGGDTDGLAILAEENVLIGPQSPNDMELHAIIVAQKGRFGRNHYTGNYRNSLEIYGSIISNGRVGTQWTSGGVMISGYAQRETYFDQNQVYSPPPFIASMSDDYKIVSWREID